MNYESYEELVGLVRAFRIRPPTFAYGRSG